MAGDDNGIPRRVRELEEEAAVCTERWGNQHRRNDMTERSLKKMEQSQARLLAWGAVLFALAGFVGSILGPAMTARINGG